MNTLQAKKMLAGAMVLSLAISGGLLIGNDRAAAAGSSGLSRQGLTVGQFAQLQDMKNRWRKQTEDHKGGTALVEEAAGILGMDQELVKKQLTEGKSLVEIAASKGMSEATLKEKLLAERSAKLEEAVKAGKLTRERADTIKNRLQEHIGSKLNQKGWSPETGFHGPGHPKKHPAGVLSQVGPEKMASILGMSKEDLVKELKAGKSLADIAQSKGMSKDQLVAKLKEELTPVLEKAVERKHEPKKDK
ncbi:hypothetical protein [Gorillibacterium sp. sgz5001074]|uniref:hypothetical protein n=1 Tax=Gorillibacterium sp. sgz5001074 TaxID=3446695 RepID=UPI003F670A4F